MIVTEQFWGARCWRGREKPVEVGIASLYSSLGNLTGAPDLE